MAIIKNLPIRNCEIQLTGRQKVNFERRCFAGVVEKVFTLTFQVNFKVNRDAVFYRKNSFAVALKRHLLCAECNSIWSWFYFEKVSCSSGNSIIARFNTLTVDIVVLMNRNHSGRSIAWLFWPSSSPSASTSPATVFAIATSATTDDNTAATTTPTRRTGRAGRTAASQEIFVLLFISFAVVHSIVFHGLVHILRHMAHSSKYWTPQGKLAFNILMQHKPWILFKCLLFLFKCFRSICQITRTAAEVSEIWHTKKPSIKSMS